MISPSCSPLCAKPAAPLQDLDDDCKLLTKHAIEPRYPKGLDLGIEDARVAYAAAQRVIEAVRSELPPSIH